MSRARSGYPFTATQWQELEHQALIYKYMASGMPVPPDLLYTIRRSLDSSNHQPQHIGWNCFQLGFGKKIDPEPGRCRRTDGKKWRCSKEAYADSKYCERHMHRGRNRSRKPVEVMTTRTTNTNTTPPTAITISSIKKNSNNYSPSTPASFSYSSEPQHSFLYPHSSSSRPPGNIGLSSQDQTKFLFDSGAYSRSASGSTSIDDNSWELAPLTMGSPLGHSKQRTYSVSQTGESYLQLQSFNESSRQQQQRQDQYNYYALGNDVKADLHMKIDTEDHQQPKKVMHHFFDELPPDQHNKDSWLDSKTHLSISVPDSSRDFFITHNGK
ncbi:growth-regulating factor 3-like [Nicotiana tabacum]|uniref:Growth-regulating factor n=1 Tax=Nicotiana tabacum TaxID=4097 RepID=A0A1S3Y645_TOBAC|nr:growth-regulating factor 1-like [Nicotiana tomentosiformis]XP_016447733.1 PREDICTED: growth-regulating factor 1-like [Nicotiana tabacum]